MPQPSSRQAGQTWPSCLRATAAAARVPTCCSRAAPTRHGLEGTTSRGALRTRAGSNRLARTTERLSAHAGGAPENVVRIVPTGTLPSRDSAPATDSRRTRRSLRFAYAYESHGPQPISIPRAYRSRCVRPTERSLLQKVCLGCARATPIRSPTCTTLFSYGRPSSRPTPHSSGSGRRKSERTSTAVPPAPAEARAASSTSTTCAACSPVARCGRSSSIAAARSVSARLQSMP
jgi:hypothetical protein